MGGGPSKEELEHQEYMERKRLERQKEENEHKERMKGKLSSRMPANPNSYFDILWLFDQNCVEYTTWHRL